MLCPAVGMGLCVGWFYAFYRVFISSAPSSGCLYSTTCLSVAYFLASAATQILWIPLEKRYGGVYRLPIVAVCAAMSMLAGGALTMAGALTESGSATCMVYFGAVIAGIGSSTTQLIWADAFGHSEYENPELMIVVALCVGAVVGLAVQVLGKATSIALMFFLPMVSSVLLVQAGRWTSSQSPKQEITSPKRKARQPWKTCIIIFTFWFVYECFRAIVSPRMFYGLGISPSTVFAVGTLVCFVVIGTLFWFSSRNTLDSAFRLSIPLLVTALFLESCLPETPLVIPYLVGFLAKELANYYVWLVLVSNIRMGVLSPACAIGRFKFFCYLASSSGAIVSVALSEGAFFVHASFAMAVALVIALAAYAPTSIDRVAFCARGDQEQPVGSQENAPSEGPLFSENDEPKEDGRAWRQEEMALIKAFERKYSLSAREAEIFEMLIRGRTVTYIKEELYISRNTVNTHVRHIYKKAGVCSKQDLLDLFESELQE